MDAPASAEAEAKPSDSEPAPEAGQDAEVEADGGAVLANGAANPTEGKAEEAEPEEPKVVLPEEPYRVLLLGDSMIATGFGALLEDKLDAHPHVVCYRKAKSATGLARPDFYDWFDQAPRQIEFRKPDLVVVIMGGNDGQDIPPWKGSKRVHWETEAWDGAYRARMDDFLGRLREPVEGEEGARVLWLGLPTMGMRSLEKKLVLIRGIQKEAVDAIGEGGIYLDTAPFLAGEDGKPLKQAEVEGKVRELRAEDGIHFTMSGAEYFADKVYPEVLGVLELPDVDVIEAMKKAEEEASAEADAEAAKAEPTPSE